MGESGSREIDREAKIASMALVDLLECHCFIWFTEFGGSVIVE